MTKTQEELNRKYEIIEAIVCNNENFLNEIINDPNYSRLFSVYEIFNLSLSEELRELLVKYLQTTNLTEEETSICANHNQLLQEKKIAIEHLINNPDNFPNTYSKDCMETLIKHKIINIEDINDLDLTEYSLTVFIRFLVYTGISNLEELTPFIEEINIPLLSNSAKSNFYNQNIWGGSAIDSLIKAVNNNDLLLAKFYFKMLYSVGLDDYFHNCVYHDFINNFSQTPSSTEIKNRLAILLKIADEFDIMNLLSITISLHSEEYKKLDFVEFILNNIEKKTTPTQKYTDKMSLLLKQIAMTGNFSPNLYQLFFDHGADPNAIDSTVVSFLDILIGNLEFYYALLGANIDNKFSEEEFAELNQNAHDTLSTIFTAGFDITNSHNRQSIINLTNPTIDNIKKFLYIANTGQITQDDLTIPLESFLKALTTILTCGIDIYPQNENGEITHLLHIEPEFADEINKLLITAHFQTQNNKIIVRILEKNIFIRLDNRQIFLLKKFIETSNDLNNKSEHGNTLLHLLAKQESLDPEFLTMAKEIATKFNGFYIQDHQGISPLTYARNNENGLYPSLLTTITALNEYLYSFFAGFHFYQSANLPKIIKALPKNIFTEIFSYLAPKEIKTINNDISKSESILNNRLKKLEKTLEKQGFKLVDVEAEGNCLFIAIAKLLRIDHLVLRKEAVEHIRNNPHLYLETFASSRNTNSITEREEYQLDEFNTYLNRMERSGEWGDNLILQAISDMYNRQILIYDTSHNNRIQEILPTNESPAEGTLRLAYVNNNHYMYIIENSITQIYQNQEGMTLEENSLDTTDQESSENSISKEISIYSSDQESLVLNDILMDSTSNSNLFASYITSTEIDDNFEHLTPTRKRTFCDDEFSKSSKKLRTSIENEENETTSVSATGEDNDENLNPYENIPTSSSIYSPTRMESITSTPKTPTSYLRIALETINIDESPELNIHLFSLFGNE